MELDTGIVITCGSQGLKSTVSIEKALSRPAAQLIGQCTR